MSAGPGKRIWTGLWAGLGLGAGLMFFGDPKLGKRRRSQARGKLLHAVLGARKGTGRATRDLSHRSSGWVQRQLSRSAQAGEADDAVLEARVRTALGRCCDHPSHIQVSVTDGTVKLTGRAASDEISLIERRTVLVPGVRQLESHLHPSSVSPVDLSRRKRSTHWTPAARLLAGTGSALAMGYGLRERGVRRWSALAVGKLLGLRAWTNLDFAHLFGIGDDRRVIDFHKELFVDAPVEEVFAFWNALENFPRFMSHVHAITSVGENVYRWKVDGPLGLSFEWEAEVTRRLPNELLSWRTVDGSVVRHLGVIRFQRIGDAATRMDLRLSYNPPGGALGHFVAAMLGVDPKSQMDDDLQRFKSLLEHGKATGRHRTAYRDELAVPNMGAPDLPH